MLQRADVGVVETDGQRHTREGRGLREDRPRNAVFEGTHCTQLLPCKALSVRSKLSENTDKEKTVIADEWQIRGGGRYGMAMQSGSLTMGIASPRTEGRRLRNESFSSSPPSISTVLGMYRVREKKTTSSHISEKKEMVRVVIWVGISWYTPPIESFFIPLESQAHCGANHIQRYKGGHKKHMELGRVVL